MKASTRKTMVGILSSALLNSVAAAVADPVGTIPFKLAGKLMLVQATINNSEAVTFVVDTGASHTVFDPKFAKQLGLETKSAASTKGTGSGDVEKSHAPAVTMILNGFKVDVPEPWVIDLSKAPLPAEVKGLVGAELFKTYTVTIDPAKFSLTVFDPASYRHSSEGASIPLIVEGDKLFLEATLEVPAGRTVRHKLRIDTGSESSVNDEIARQSEEVRKSTLGGGLGQNFASYSGVFSSAKIGPYTIRHFWGPAGPGPAIGMELLRRFIITFDAPHGRLYLEPTPQLDEPVPTPPPN